MPLSSNFDQMSVVSIKDGHYLQLRDPAKTSDKFSIFNPSSGVSPEFLDSHFFQATMFDWHTHSRHPQCLLDQNDTDAVSLGSIFDADVLKQVIMLDNGFNENFFPPSVVKEAAKMKA